MENPLASDLDHILSHTKNLWEEVRGQRLFITGGTGFFGCWLLESFVWANDKLGLGSSVLVLTRNPEAFQRKVPHLADHLTVQFHRGDVRSFTFPEGHFSHIIHAAAETSLELCKEDPLLVFDTIVEGTRRTLDLAVHCKASKILLTSSGAVYGKQSPEIEHLSEEYNGAPAPTDPSSVYGEGKRVGELLCSNYAKKYGMETKIARCFALVGPYLPLEQHFAIGNFIRDGLTGSPIYVNGDGTPYRSYLYAADLVIWLWHILFRGKSCRPYNVGSEKQIQIEALARFIASLFNPTREVKIRFPSNLNQPPERYVPDTQRAHSEMGLKVYVDLGDAIKRTIIWYSQYFGGPSLAKTAS
jgi:dTDP-glucose 4,6-dehydratase